MNIKIQDKICFTCKKEIASQKQSYCLKCQKEKHTRYNNNKYKVMPYNGWIYVVANPSWNGWVKIGRAINVERRIVCYNTSSPFRDYELVFCTRVNNPNLIEKYFFEKYGTENNEWFNISKDEAIYQIKKLIERI